MGLSPRDDHEAALYYARFGIIDEQDPPDPDDFDTMIDEQDDLYARGGYDE